MEVQVNIGGLKLGIISFCLNSHSLDKSAQFVNLFSGSMFDRVVYGERLDGFFRILETQPGHECAFMRIADDQAFIFQQL